MRSRWAIDRALLLRFGAEAITKGSSFLIMPLLVRLMGVDGYGQFTFSQAAISAMVPLVSLGLGFSLVRQIAGITDQETIQQRLGGAIAIASAIALPLTVALWFSAPLLAAFIGPTADSTPLIKMSCLLLLASVWQGLTMEALRARLETGAATALQVAEAVALPFGIGLLVWANRLDPAAFIGFAAALKLVVAGCAFYRVIDRSALFRPRLWLLPVEDIRNALSIGTPFMVAGLGEWLMALGDRFAVGSITGAESVGHYASAQTLVAVLASWGAPFWWVLFPRFCASLEQRDRMAAVTSARAVGGLFLEGGIPLLVFLALAGSQILQLLGGPKLHVEPTVITLLAGAAFINQAASPWEYALYAERRGGMLMRATLICGLATLGLSIMALPVLGLTGAALAAVAGRVGFAAMIISAAYKMGYDHTILVGKTQLRRIATATMTSSIAAGSIAVAASFNAIPGKAPLSVLAAAAFISVYAASAFGLRFFRPRQQGGF
ncbi:oligosaccharide flippase family protein [Ferrovibrio sp.]|uniref:lipopolysaccharide biosynthesis protein n=1 Tax=Ferrovibrio sp. TaxID=1917215 RepID=UPI00262BDE0D|nr:oligosaccharide flippase family protein [Ferrovibrio sp.]